MIVLSNDQGLCGAAQYVERFVGVFCHVCFTRYYLQNLSVMSDNEGLPPIWERPQPFHPKLLRDGPIRIR